MADRNTYRWLAYLGHLIFLALLILAWEHAVLRSTIADTAFQFFKWVNNDGLNVEAHRYTALLPQLLVKGGKLLGLDLSELMLTSSLGHVLVGYVVFVVCTHVLRSRPAAVGCALATVLATRLTFYSPVLEANYLLCYPFLFLGVLVPSSAGEPAGSWSRNRIGLACLAALPTLIVHPFGGPVLVAFTWITASVQRWSSRSVLWATISICLVALVWRSIFPATAYESSLVNAAIGGVGQRTEGGTWFSVQFLWAHCFRESNAYLPLVLFSGIVLGSWLVLRKWLAGLVNAVVFAGMTCVYFVLMRSGDTAIMMERALLPVSAVVASSFALLLLNSANKLQTFLLGLTLIAVAFKVRDISFASRQFNEVVEHAGHFSKELAGRGIRKACVDEGQLSGKNWYSGWAAPVELLLLTAKAAPDSSATFMVVGEGHDHDCSFDGGLSLKDYHLPLPKMNDHYFRLPSGPYVRLPEEH